MAMLNKKIDFILFVSVMMANPNGDPLNGNRPRFDYNNRGEITAECIKRKIRNRMQDMGYEIFVQSNERCSDGCKSLSERAKKYFKDIGKKEKDLSQDEYANLTCDKWLDVRSFGQVFAFSGKEEKEGVSVGVRGPVSVHQAVSIDPVDVCSYQITKSVNGADAKGKAPDTMGMKHMVKFGLYEIKGSINVQLAEKTGFTDEDAKVIKECLLTLFENDSSSARPDGSMEVVRMYWWEHNCKAGQYSSAKVHRSVKAVLKDGIIMPSSVDHYDFEVNALYGLEPEILEGY